MAFLAGGLFNHAMNASVDQFPFQSQLRSGQIEKAHGEHVVIRSTSQNWRLGRCF